MTHEVVRTRAGVLAMRSVEAGEIMHPGVGPVVEAERLYVLQSRLAERLATSRGSLTLFDVGLGAGSNAAAAWNVSERADADAARLELVSFERDLGALELALAEGAAFGLGGPAGEAAQALLTHGQHQSPRTSWRLRRGDLLASLDTENALADVVFWDPFSPRANPALWTIAAFAAVRRRAASRATLYTYSASTAIRIALLLSGWAVGVGDGIGDKAETTAAAVDPRDLARPLDRRWLARVTRPGAPMPSDAPGDAPDRVTALAQFRS